MKKHGALSLRNQTRSKATANQMTSPNKKELPFAFRIFARRVLFSGPFSQFPSTRCFLTSRRLFFWFSRGLRSFDICPLHTHAPACGLAFSEFLLSFCNHDCRTHGCNGCVECLPLAFCHRPCSVLHQQLAHACGNMFGVH